MIPTRMMPMGAGGKPSTGYWGLCFTAEQANSSVAMVTTGNAPSVSLEHSTDASNWTPFEVGRTTITLASVGDMVYLRAGSGGNTKFGTDLSNYNSFALTGKIAASGNIMSMLNGSTPLDSITEGFCFCGLFENAAALTQAPELPARVVSSQAYAKLFRLCSSLLKGPTLRGVSSDGTPACGRQLFDNCSSLKEISVNWTSWPPSLQRAFWARGLAAGGVFRCPLALGTNETITRGNSNCPNGWTVINTD